MWENKLGQGLVPGGPSTARIGGRWATPGDCSDEGRIVLPAFFLKVNQFFQGCWEHSVDAGVGVCCLPMLPQREGCSHPSSPTFTGPCGFRLEPQFKTFNFFHVIFVSLLWAILTYPVFRLRSWQLRFLVRAWGQRVFWFVIPMQCCFLEKICSWGHHFYRMPF